MKLSEMQRSDWSRLDDAWQDADVVFTDCRLVDGLADEPLDGAAVTVRAGRIVAVASTSDLRRSDVDGQLVVDLEGRVLMPGLIDLHEHMIYAGFRSLEAIETCPVEQAAANSAFSAWRLVHAGYTTVRDLGTIGNTAVAIRDAVNAGRLPGARVVASGRVINTSRGPLDEHPGCGGQLCGFGIVADGPSEMARRVREQAALGVDNVKLMASGLELSPRTRSWDSAMEAEEIAAAVSEARAHGLTIAVHAQSRDTARFAVQNRVDTLEHGTRLDGETLELLGRHHATLVPTLSTMFSVIEHGAALGLPPKQRAEMDDNRVTWLESFRNAREAGAVIGAGGDVGNKYEQGENAKEIGLLVDQGATPMEALRAATSVAAACLGYEGSVGSIAPGRFADMLVVDGHPEEDPSVLLDTARRSAVLIEGRLAAGSVLGPDVVRPVARTALSAEPRTVPAERS